MSTQEKQTTGAVAVGCGDLLACPVCGGAARRGKHGAVECVNYCSRSAMHLTWAQCVADWNCPNFRPNCGPFTRADLQANK